VRESAKRHFVSGIFILSLLLSSYILYRETELYVNTYYALSSLKARVLEISVIQKNVTETPQICITLKLAIYNPSSVEVKILSLDFTRGIFLNGIKLSYYKPKIHNYLNILIPGREERMLYLRFTITSPSDMQYLIYANTTRQWNWYFIIYSIVRAEFKEGRINLSSSFEGVSNFTVTEE